MEKEEIVSVEEKVKIHPYWVDRMLTKWEFDKVKQIPKKYKFKYGEILPNGTVAMGYRMRSLNGIINASPERFAKIVKGYRGRWLKEKSDPSRTTERAGQREKRAKNSEYRKKMSLYAAKWNKNRKLKDPKFCVLTKLRTRLRSKVTNTIKYKRKYDMESVSFLLWLAAKTGVDPTDGKKWHIDHLHPLSHWNLLEESEQRAANAPENVRWMAASQNNSKYNFPPTWKEWIDHLYLVEEWRNEIARNSQDLISQN